MDSGRHSQVAGLACMLIISISTTCWGQVIYVDDAALAGGNGSSWANACRYLQDGLAQAAGTTKPVEVRVAQGIYKPDQGAGRPPGDRTATFQLLNGVTLKGGYAGATAAGPDARDVALYETTLSGDLAGNDGSDGANHDDNSCHVVTASGTDETPVIDGFTIAAGSPTSGACDRLAREGCGMWIDAASPRITGCRFVGDRRPTLSGTVLADHGSRPILTNCTFLNNGDTGMHNRANSRSVLTRCRFEGQGRIGLDNQGSTLVITDCVFTGISGYAISTQDCNLALTNCVFERNGKGVYSANGDLTLANCTFISQKGAGIDGARSLVARDCVFRDNAGGRGGAISARRVELSDCEFSGNSGRLAGAVHVTGDKLVATRCLFAGNSGATYVGSFAGAIAGGSGVVRLLNCTFAGNRGRPTVLEHWTDIPLAPVELTGCIVWNGPDPFLLRPAPQTTIRYSDVQGGYPGAGNIEVDPCFVDPGYWGDPIDPSIELGPEDRNAVWVAGDYHLKSQAGHWDSVGRAWVRDEVTSACIDAGDPNSPLGIEPFPNGGVLNLGAYGGSAQASKSYFGEPVCETQMPGDINGDCTVDATDQAILLSHWLMEGTPVVNTAPTIKLTTPEGGSVVYGSTPVSLHAEATDTDGIVIKVDFRMEYHGNGSLVAGKTDADGADGWGCELKWGSVVPPDGATCTIRAEAMDDRGATAAAAPVQVTYHATK